MSTPATRRIMIIRHGEKPADDPPPQGVNADGDAGIQSLIPQGWQRAGALACLFDPARGPLQSPGISTPQTIFASGVGHHSNSLRPQQTVTPLSQKLGLTIDTSWLKGQETEMTAAAVARGGVVLVCWEHQAIPGIANQILGNDTTAPQKWPGSRFDMVWVFDLDASTGTYAFSQVPQQLLAEDSSDPITG